MIRFSAALFFALVGTCFALSATASADGVPDRSFGGDGRITLDAVLGSSENPNDVAIDSKGRIIVVGFATDPVNSRGYVARFLSDGSPDLSFNGDGVVVYSPKTSLSAVEIDSQDRIVTAGNDASGVTGFDFFATRLLASGGSDSSFSGDGVQTVNFGGTSADAAYDLALDAQGRTVISGYSNLTGATSFAVARLKADGEPDLTLNGTGFGVPDVGGTFSIGNSLAIDAEGRILIAGGLTEGAVTNFLVIRLRPEGSFDPSFHSNGRVIVDFATAPEESASEVLIDAQKRIILAGFVRQALNTPYDTAVARLKPDGILDPTFSGDGRVITTTPESDFTRDATLDPAGRVVTSGSLTTAETLPTDALMMRFGADGSYDPTFGENGFLFEDFFASTADGWGVAVDGQGRYVMLGRSFSGTETRTSLARFTVEYPKPPDPDPDPGPNPAGSKCSGKAATISGTPGKDTIKGTKKRDVIAALGGNDVIKGFGGNDLACGGNGNDKLVGGPGSDNLRGDAGRDKLLGGPGKDKLSGGKGKDRCKGGPGKNRLNTCESR